MSPKTRVPVSTQVTQRPKSETAQRFSRPVGLNKHHEARLITSLVEYYGWTLCADGNLYNPYPGLVQGERDAA